MKKNSNPVFFREMKESLTPTEEKIVAFIEGNISEMIRLSISELAARCDASESGIVRLCKKMGFKGYQDMKIALAQYVASNDEVKYLNEIQHGIQKIPACGRRQGYNGLCFLCYSL